MVWYHQWSNLNCYHDNHGVTIGMQPAAVEWRNVVDDVDVLLYR